LKYLTEMCNYPTPAGCWVVS